MYLRLLTRLSEQNPNFLVQIKNKTTWIARLNHIANKSRLQEGIHASSKEHNHHPEYNTRSHKKQYQAFCQPFSLQHSKHYNAQQGKIHRSLTI